MARFYSYITRETRHQNQQNKHGSNDGYQKILSDASGRLRTYGQQRGFLKYDVKGKGAKGMDLV